MQDLEGPRTGCADVCIPLLVSRSVEISLAAFYSNHSRTAYIKINIWHWKTAEPKYILKIFMVIKGFQTSTSTQKQRGQRKQLQSHVTILAHRISIPLEHIHPESTSGYYTKLHFSYYKLNAFFR